MNHLAIVRADVATKILSGKKTVESRLSKNRPACWNSQVGDTVYFKVSGGDVVCSARVGGVDKYERIRPDDVRAIAELYSPAMHTTPENPYWNIKSESRYAVLIHLANVTPCHFSKAALPRSFGAAWVTNCKLENIPPYAETTSQLPLLQHAPI